MLGIAARPDHSPGRRWVSRQLLLKMHTMLFGEAELEPTEWGRLTALAHVHHCFGNKAESDAALARLIADHAADSAFQIAAIHGVRGETDAAFEWLDRAYAQHDSGLSLAYIEPSFRSLHGDPRWQALVDKVGFERS